MQQNFKKGIFDIVREAITIENYFDDFLKHKVTIARRNEQQIVSTCPLHGGDNKESFKINLLTGYASCFSRDCTQEGTKNGINIFALCRKDQGLKDDIEAAKFLLTHYKLGEIKNNSPRKNNVTSLKSRQLEKENEKKLDEKKYIPYQNWVYTDREMQPVSHYKNLEVVLKHLDINTSYDTMKNQLHINIPNMEFNRENKITNSLTHIRAEARRFGLKITADDFRNYMQLLADNHRFNPAKDYLQLCYESWDKESRIQDFLDTIKVTENFNNDLKEILIKKWMLSAVAVLFEEKAPKLDGILTLQSNRQGLGKTYWLRSLIPYAYQSEWFKEGSQLDPESTKNIMENLSVWINELGELEQTMKKDISAIKGFVTSDMVRVQKKYQNEVSEIEKRTIFCATVNSKEFLRDETGDRRFWVIECEEINSYYRQTIDIDQVWGEFVSIYKESMREHKIGEPYCWNLTKDEILLLEESNKDFRIESRAKDALGILFDFEAPKHKWKYIKQSIIKHLAYENGIKDIKLSEYKKAITHEIQAIESRKNNIRYYLLPPLKKTTSTNCISEGDILSIDSIKNNIGQLEYIEDIKSFDEI